MNWDQWVGSLDGRPVMLIKRLARAFGRRIDLHKFIRSDDVGCFHTHPARAIRIVFWGGYVEEFEDGTLVWRMPGHVGFIRPETSHRVHALLDGRSSWSLWLRGRCRHGIELRGPGWPAEHQFHLGAVRAPKEPA
jgi:hypothetical protein